MRTIALATTPEPGSKVAPTLPTALLERLTNEELMTLLKAYNDGCDKLDPAMETISPSELAILIEAAKKNPLALTELPRPHLEKLALCLLTPAESPEDNTSGGMSTE